LNTLHTSFNRIILLLCVNPQALFPSASSREEGISASLPQPRALLLQALDWLMALPLLLEQLGLLQGQLLVA
jgi:hypothetical protein